VSNEIYHSNLAVLKERFPAVYDYLQRSTETLPFRIELFSTRDGQTSALATLADGRRIALYEAENIRESAEQTMTAWQLEAQDILFFNGMGLGYYPLAAVELFDSRPSIVIIEHSATLFELALRTVDLRPLFNYPWLALFIGKHISAADIVEKYRFSIFLGRQRVVTHAAARAIFGPCFETIERDLKDSIGLAKDLWHTNQELGKEMLVNVMANLPGLFEGAPLGKMKGAFAGIPAVCVAAGPSLDAALPVLKAIQDRSLIVALDSAVSSLIPAGIRPHLVVTCDTRKSNFEKLRPFLDRLRQSILIFALESNPDNVRAFLGPRRLAVASNNSILTNWLEPLFGFNCNLAAMSTVSHTAVLTLLELGADPIALVGMDMAFNLDRSHAEQAIHHYDVCAAELIDVIGTKGTPVHTYRPLLDYTRQLERIISNSQVRFINTCLNGTPIKGALIKSLAEFVASELDKAGDVSRLLASMNWQYPVDRREIVSVMAKMRCQLEKFQDQCALGVSRIDRLCEQLHNGCPAADAVHRKKTITAFYDALQDENRMLVGILSSIRLKEIRQIEVQRMLLQRQLAEDPGSAALIEELNLIKTELSSQLDAAGFFGALVGKTEDYYKSLSRLHAKLARQPEDASTFAAIAGLHAAAGEVMRAEMYYLKALEISPDNIPVRLELARLYCDLGLWQIALEYINESGRNYSTAEEIAKMKVSIEARILSIKDQTRQAWVKGDAATTSRLLNEYLQFHPQDEQLNLLRRVIKEMQATFTLDFLKFRQKEIKEKRYEELLADAVKYLEDLQFEPAIGLIEGLIEKHPAEAAALREKIGDIRLLQQDYPSAVWNYEQVLRAAPNASEIKAKISQARLAGERGGKIADTKQHESTICQ